MPQVRHARREALEALLPQMTLPDLCMLACGSGLRAARADVVLAQRTSALCASLAPDDWYDRPNAQQQVLLTSAPVVACFTQLLHPRSLEPLLARLA